MNENTPELSIILPAYNEGSKIKKNIESVKQKLDSLDVEYEIIVVNDGSRDNTYLEAQKCEARNIKILTYPQNRGKGYAINYGMMYSRGQYRLFMDADLSTSLDEIKKFLDTIKHDGYDIVIGTRKSTEALQTVKQPFYRRALGKVFTYLAGCFVGYGLSDFTCGFKMFTKKASEIIFKRQRIFNWAFDAEVIFIAMRHNLRICELPVTWRNDPQTKVRLLRDISTSFYGLFKIRINHLKGHYR